MLRELIARSLIAAVTCLPVVATAASAVPAIVQAAVKGDAAAVRALLAKGADPNASRGDGRTAMMEAAAGGRYDIVRDLMVHGARKELKDGQGRTAFDFALERQHSDIIALLRDAS